MAIKIDLLGIMIYATMIAYLLGFVLAVAGKYRFDGLFYFLGFVVCGSAWLLRWWQVGHIPMQNLFEVFLTMGAVMYPLSRFCEVMLGVNNRRADMLLGVILLFPAGFVFSSHPEHLPASLQCWLFGPHVAVYVISYIIMGKAALQAGQCVWAGGSAKGDAKAEGDVDGKVETTVSTKDMLGGDAVLTAERNAYKLVCFGFPLLTLGLALGSWWGFLAWGDYWGWDPKELWSLVSWLVYAGYLHYRYINGVRKPRGNCVWVLVGALVIVITLLWVNLSKLFPGLHSYAT